MWSARPRARHNKARQVTTAIHNFKRQSRRPYPDIETSLPRHVHRDEMIKKGHAISNAQRSESKLLPKIHLQSLPMPFSPTPMLCCLSAHSLVATSYAYCWYPCCAKARVICYTYWAALPHSPSNFSDPETARLTSTPNCGWQATSASTPMCGNAQTS